MIECLFGSRGSRFHHENQDAFGLKSCSADTVFLGVSDGAGSASDSALGSTLSVESAVSSADLGLLPAFQAASDVLSGDRNKACTLSLVIWSNDSLSIGVVGDSPVVALIDGTWHLFTEPPSSEFINETRFLTSSNNHPLCFEASGNVEAVFVFSDGLSSLLLSENHPYDPALNGILSRAKAGSLDIDSLLAWLDQEHTLADDVTLIVAYAGE